MKPVEIIGITKRDDERRAREKDIDELWPKLTKASGITETYTLFSSAIDLMRETISCYRNGAYMATAIMCRSVVETVVWYAATREIAQFDSGRMTTEMDIKILDDAKFGSVLKELKRKYAISGNIESEINRIRNKGNFVAHYGSLVHKRSIKDINAFVHWLNRKDARDLIGKTVKVIVYVYQEVLHNHSSSY